MMKVLVLSLLFVSFNNCFSKPDLSKQFVGKRFAVVTASFNNVKYVQKYLDSIACQTYKNFRVVYYDDCSDDGMSDYIQAYLENNSELKSKFRLVKNKINVGAHENIYRAVHSLDDDEIVLIVDGDDWLAGDDVLEYLNKVYLDSSVWITYGRFMTYPGGKSGNSEFLPKDIISKNKIRSYKWVTSHLRTFYAWLYKRIKIEDLIFDGKFVRVCGDVAIMFPMLEMSGFHSKFINKILYVYNTDNSNSYWRKLRNNKASINTAKNVSSKIKKLPQYKPLLKSDLE